MPSGTSLTLQETASKLLSETFTGTLSTFSVSCQGAPFGSWVPFAVNGQGHPIFLISALAEHYRNFVANSRASLCVIEASSSKNPARLTLVGDVVLVPKDKQPEAAGAYLSRHPHAQLWLEMGDFQLFELVPVSTYLVAGFGQMGWLAPPHGQ